MARIRYLKPEFFKDEDLAQYPFNVRLFFAGLWGLADREGRLEERLKRLKVEIFPYDDVDIEGCLAALATEKAGRGRPFILRYEVNGERFIQILNWFKHQKPHHTEKESFIPPYNPPLKDKNTSSLKGMGMGSVHEASHELKDGDLTVNSRLNINPKQTTIDQRLKAFNKVLEDEKLVQAWKTAYPAANVNSAIWRKMEAWIRSNPEKSNKKNWKRFINNWLAKAEREAKLKGATVGRVGQDDSGDRTAALKAATRTVEL